MINIFAMHIMHWWLDGFASVGSLNVFSCITGLDHKFGRGISKAWLYVNKGVQFLWELPLVISVINKLAMKILVNKNMAPQSPFDSTTQKVQKLFRWSNWKYWKQWKPKLNILNLLLSCDMNEGLYMSILSKNLRIDQNKKIKFTNLSVIMNYLKVEGVDNHFI